MSAEEWDIEGDFGQGWELVTCCETKAEAIDETQNYRANDPDHAYRYRKVKR